MGKQSVTMALSFFINSSYYPLMIPKLYYIDSTSHSIFLKWEVDHGRDNMVYRIELKDRAYTWMTKYWGLKTECEIKNLGPETLYYFRLGVSLEPGGEEVFSDVLKTATKDAPPMLFYLFKSAERGDIKGLTSFIAERKDSAALDAFDRNGDTALIKAVKKNELISVNKLLTSGANVNQGAYGTNRTPLMYVSFLGLLDIAEILIQNGADVNQTDCNNCGALHYAVDFSQLKLVKLYLESGAGINNKDSIGWTPLMRAVIHNSSNDIIKELLQAGADVEVSDRYGKTAIDLAHIDGSSSSTIDTFKDYHQKKQIISEESITKKREGNKDLWPVSVETCKNELIANKEIKQDIDIIDQGKATYEDIEKSKSFIGALVNSPES